MRKRLDNTRFLGKMFPTTSFYEKTFVQHRFSMASCSQQDCFMRRPLENTISKRDLWYSAVLREDLSNNFFYETTLGNSLQDVSDKIFYETTVGRQFYPKMFPAGSSSRQLLKSTLVHLVGKHAGLWLYVPKKIFYGTLSKTI